MKIHSKHQSGGFHIDLDHNSANVLPAKYHRIIHTRPEGNYPRTVPGAHYMEVRPKNILGNNDFCDRRFLLFFPYSNPFSRDIPHNMVNPRQMERGASHSWENVLE